MVVKQEEERKITIVSSDEEEDFVPIVLGTEPGPAAGRHRPALPRPLPLLPFIY